MPPRPARTWDWKIPLKPPLAVSLSNHGLFFSVNSLVSMSDVDRVEGFVLLAWPPGIWVDVRVDPFASLLHPDNEVLMTTRCSDSDGPNGHFEGKPTPKDTTKEFHIPAGLSALGWSWICMETRKQPNKMKTSWQESKCPPTRGAQQRHSVVQVFLYTGRCFAITGSD